MLPKLTGKWALTKWPGIHFHVLCVLLSAAELHQHSRQAVLPRKSCVSLPSVNVLLCKGCWGLHPSWVAVTASARQGCCSPRDTWAHLLPFISIFISFTLWIFTNSPGGPCWQAPLRHRCYHKSIPAKALTQKEAPSSQTTCQCLLSNTSTLFTVTCCICDAGSL